MRDEVVWCDRGWLPTFFGFCPSERAWNKEMKRIGATMAYPDSDGRCSTFENDATRQRTILVTIAEHLDGRDPIALIGMIAHEATHVWQQILDDIGEKQPSAEFEAYAMQNIVMGLYKAYLDTRGARKQRRKVQ